MGTLTVKSSTIQSAADYENKDVNIAMSLNYNTSTGVISLISIWATSTATLLMARCSTTSLVSRTFASWAISPHAWMTFRSRSRARKTNFNREGKL